MILNIIIIEDHTFFGIAYSSFQIKRQLHSTQYPDIQVRYNVVEDLSTRRFLSML